MEFVYSALAFVRKSSEEIAPALCAQVAIAVMPPHAGIWRTVRSRKWRRLHVSISFWSKDIGWSVNATGTETSTYTRTMLLQCIFSPKFHLKLEFLISARIVWVWVGFNMMRWWDCFTCDKPLSLAWICGQGSCRKHKQHDLVGVWYHTLLQYHCNPQQFF